MLNKYWNDAVMHLNISQTLQGSCTCTCTCNEKIRDLSISGREKQPATTRCNAACRWVTVCWYSWYKELHFPYRHRWWRTLGRFSSLIHCCLWGNWRRRLKADRGVEISLESERHLFWNLHLNVRLCSLFKTPVEKDLIWMQNTSKPRFDFKQIRIWIWTLLVVCPARRHSLMLHFLLVLAAGVPQVLLRMEYRLWMPADAKATNVKPQHIWSLL